MDRIKAGVGLAALLGLGGCAVQPPAAPSVLAMPGQGKTYDQFQADDYVCRGAGQQASGGGAAARQATNQAVGTAAAGTVLGAAAGALIGSTAGAVGAGAAIGAGAGLLAGSAVGASGAQYSAAELQQRYDFAYIQCMSSKGNSVQQPPAATAVVAPGPYYGYPGPYYAYPPVYYGWPRYYYPRPYYRYGYPY